MVLSCAAVLLTPATSAAQGKPPDLGQLSIEDLLNVEVTAASRKEQRAADVAAAVFVITHDDIRRSGLTTIPELLRLAPGVDIAQINGNKWAVSVRGFNGLWANKLLVLVDGRTVYSRLFSGVIWDALDLFVDDLDRIEVIRGPSAATWGANAMNGVINIITKSTADTLGALIRVDGGGAGHQAAVRYGATLGPASYRLYAQGTTHAQTLMAPETGAGDSSSLFTTGFRSDWTTRPGTYLLEGHFTASKTHGLWRNFDMQTAAGNTFTSEQTDTVEGHLLGRWTRTRASGAEFQVQSFIDITDRLEPVGHYQAHTFDVDWQYHAPLGTRQDLVTGAGYRFIGEKFPGRFGVSMTPAQENTSLFTAFVQDEIGFYDHRLALTLGSQVQHDSLTGAGVQPTARVMWKGFAHQRLWVAAARALRTPSLMGRGVRVEYPPVPGLGGLPVRVTMSGNPEARTESLKDLEAGYRLEIAANASMDVTAFAGRYSDLRTTEVAAPQLQLVPSPHILVTSQFGNQLDANTRGIEVTGQWVPVPAWRLDASYSAFHITPMPAASSRDPAAATTDAATPRTQWQLRAAYRPGTKVSLNLAVFHVGPLEQFKIAGYTRADINAEWQVTSRWSVQAIGQNLFDAAHAEFDGTDALMRATLIRRRAGVSLRWAIR